MDQTAETVVIGAGLVGLSVAWELARSGQRVVVVDRGEAGCGATFASAWMLAPYAEAKHPGPALDLGIASLKRYPAFLEELAADSGEVVRLESHGMLRIASGNEALLSWARATGTQIEDLDGAALRKFEPLLAEGIARATFSPDETSIDVVALVRALVVALRKRGATIVENEPVVGIGVRDGRAVSVSTERRSIACEHVVIAAGAWSDAVSKSVGTPLGVRPVRGQILALRPRTMPAHIIYGDGIYVVPRGDRAIVGATQEEVGFDDRTTASGVAGLLHRVMEILPSFRDAEVIESWAGLRPGSGDGLPILGPVDGCSNVFAATGHFRNGILLAPVTAALIRDMIVANRVPALAMPFLPSRFSPVFA